MLNLYRIRWGFKHEALCCKEEIEALKADNEILKRAVEIAAEEQYCPKTEEYCKKYRCKGCPRADNGCAYCAIEQARQERGEGRDGLWPKI